jgi:hypothetical protein
MKITNLILLTVGVIYALPPPSLPNPIGEALRNSELNNKEDKN